MDGQRQRSSGGRRRRRTKPKKEVSRKAEPVLIVARRPDAPRVKTPSRNIAASARPRRRGRGISEAPPADEPTPALDAEKPRRAARIVKATPTPSDDAQATRQRLLERLLLSEGRSAISRAAEALDEQQMVVPEEQEHQLQLLEHVDERRARAALEVIARLLQHETPVKRPILDQRLRRLEQEADDAETRVRAAQLRRALRVA